MNLPKIVCPFDPGLIQSITGCALVVRVKHISDVAEAAEQVGKSRNRLACVIVESDDPLADMKFPEQLQNIPLAVMAVSFGRFSNLARQVNMLRGLNLRVYLPCANPENIAGLRILSSLGIHGCAMFGNGATDWEAIADLMTYALLERTPHGSIEPFTFIASNYDPLSYLDWGFLYFDDPERFLHLDENGRVALSHAELLKQRFIADNILELSEPAKCLAISDRQEAWREYFIDNHPCASCDGWKICVGRFAARIPEDRGCSDFFREMLSVVRQYKARKIESKEHPIWQP